MPYPEWLVEGFAEFMSTAQFERDGTVGLGLPATHRYYGLVNLKQLPLETLLSVDPVAWRHEVESIGKYLDEFRERVPAQLREELKDVQKRLG